MTENLYLLTLQKDIDGVTFRIKWSLPPTLRNEEGRSRRVGRVSKTELTQSESIISSSFSVIESQQSTGAVMRTLVPRAGLIQLAVSQNGRIRT